MPRTGTTAGGLRPTPPASTNKPPAASTNKPKKAGVYNPREEAKAREEAQKQQAAALAAAEKRAADAEEQKSQAQIRVSELEYSLTAASERDVGMSNLLSSLGQNSFSLNGIDWSTAEAKALLEQEAAAMAEVDALISNVRAGSVACKEMYAEQEALQQSLRMALPVQAA